jgi:hypothetical protein
MDNLYNYLTDPTTIINAVVLIFTLGVTRANLNTKLRELENRIEKIEDLDLDSRLTKMQVDLDRIKTVLDELKKK